MRETQNSENKRPGFLVYYETLDALSEYSEAETGAFVRAMAEYARYGVIPDFDDRGLRGLWRVVQPFVDRDEAKYNERCRKTRYSGYVSGFKRRYQKEHPGKEPVEGRDYLIYEDWCLQIGIQQLPSTDVNDCQQTITDANHNNKDQNKNGKRDITEKGNNQDKTKNYSENVNQKGEPGETTRGELPQVAASCGELRQTSFELRQKWNAALDAGDMQTAMNLANELSRMGYITDPKTREMKLRG